MNDFIYMSGPDKSKIRNGYITIDKFAGIFIFELKPNKFWIRHNNFECDYGPFDYTVQAIGWLKEYFKELSPHYYKKRLPFSPYML